MGRIRNLGEGVTGWVIINGTPFCNVDPRLDFSGPMPLEFSGYRTLAVYPLIKDNQIYGALSLYSARVNEYDESHLQLIEGAAKLTAAALGTWSETASRVKPQTTDEDSYRPYDACV